VGGSWIHSTHHNKKHGEVPIGLRDLMHFLVGVKQIFPESEKNPSWRKAYTSSFQVREREGVKGRLLGFGLRSSSFCKRNFEFS
jgi:hypothetical protein